MPSAVMPARTMSIENREHVLCRLVADVELDAERVLIRFARILGIVPALVRGTISDSPRTRAACRAPTWETAAKKAVRPSASLMDSPVPARDIAGWNKRARASGGHRTPTIFCTWPQLEILLNDLLLRQWPPRTKLMVKSLLRAHGVTTLADGIRRCRQGGTRLVVL